MARRIFAVFVVLLLGLVPMWAADPDVLRIGFVESVMREAPPSRRKVFGDEFSQLVKDIAGLKSVVTEGINPETAAKQLDDEKWHLGVFHGVEFAWVAAKHPRLKPFMVASRSDVPVRAVLVVKKEGGATGIADLKGKKIAMLEFLHCRLFADKLTGKTPDYFAGIALTRSNEDALGDVLLDKVQGAIVDTPALAFYKDLQPGRYKLLKIAAESDVFPPGLIVYREGCLSDRLLAHLKDSMLKADQTDKGRDYLREFRVSKFQVVPDDFAKQLADILRAYPAPEF